MFGLDVKADTCEVGISDDILRQVFGEDAGKIKVFLELRDLVLAYPFAARNKSASGGLSIFYMEDMFVGCPAFLCNAVDEYANIMGSDFVIIVRKLGCEYDECRGVRFYDDVVSVGRRVMRALDELLDEI